MAVTEFCGRHFSVVEYRARTRSVGDARSQTLREIRTPGVSNMIRGSFPLKLQLTPFIGTELALRER
jgi:hypothetical protein